MNVLGMVKKKPKPKPIKNIKETRQRKPSKTPRTTDIVMITFFLIPVSFYQGSMLFAFKNSYTKIKLGE